MAKLRMSIILFSCKYHEEWDKDLGKERSGKNMRIDEDTTTIQKFTWKGCRRTTLAVEGKGGKPNSRFQPARDTPLMRAPHLQPRSASLLDLTVNILSGS